MTNALSFVGHEAERREVEAAWGSGRMPHAWLICGIEGIGKATFAKHIAQFVLTGGQEEIGKSDMGHRASKLVDAETHPDLLIIRRPVDEKTGELRSVIPVDETLKIAAFLHKTATHGGWRVVILDEAHALNRHGQNAILKIVEEPPPHTLILVTVTTPGILLPTIRSRARVLHLAPLSNDEMRRILHHAAAEVSQEDLSAVIDLSGGSIGFALKILRTETLPLYREMLGMLDAMPQCDIARLHKLADQMARKADADSFDVLSALLIERLRETVSFEAHREQDTESGKRINLALKIWEKTRATLESVDHSSLDRKLAFVNAMNEIRAAV